MSGANGGGHDYSSRCLVMCYAFHGAPVIELSWTFCCWLFGCREGLFAHVSNDVPSGKVCVK